jgi:hypothetical protein
MLLLVDNLNYYLLSCAFLILLDYDKIVAMEGESQNIG